MQQKSFCPKLFLPQFFIDRTIRFQACFKSIGISPNWIKSFLVDAQLIQYFNIEDVYFSLNINIFHHLKLEIALAIPASNE